MYASAYSEYTLAGNMGFPQDNYMDTVSGLGSIIVPDDLVSNVTKLHEFLFGTTGYTPSSTVQNVSGNIQYTVNSAGSSETDDDDDTYYDDSGYDDSYTDDQSEDSSGSYVEQQPPAGSGVDDTGESNADDTGGSSAAEGGDSGTSSGEGLDGAGTGEGDVSGEAGVPIE